MSKGDTTIRIDMEVAGASSAKMTAKDVYQSIESASKKATSAEEAEMRKRAAAAKSLAAQKKRMTRQNEDREFRDWQRNENKKIESVALLQAQRSKAIIANTKAEEQEKQRLARETAAEMKHIAREHERDSKRRMREEARDAKMLARQKGMVGGLMGRGLWAGAMGVAGYAGVAGVGGAISGISQGIQAVIDKKSELEKAITPIVALENNAEKMGSIRQEVVRTSLAVGRSYEEVGQFYADLVGSTGNLAKSERESLIKETKELSELTGGSLVTAQNLLTKSYQIYGKELESVNQLQNKLMMTQDQGSITFEDMGLRLPELLQTGKFAGLNIDEVLGTVIGTTRKSGSIEKTMTGMRNFFLIMEEAHKKGINLTGNYTDQLEQLAGMFQSNAPQMQELFGKEVVVHASSVTDAIIDIVAAMRDLGKVTSDTDAVADKLSKKFQDPTFFRMRDMENLQQTMESAPNWAGEANSESGIMQAHRRGLQGATAVQTGTGGIFGVLGKISGYLGGLISPELAQEGADIAASTREGEFFKQSTREKFFTKKQTDLNELESRRGEMAASGAGTDFLNKKIAEVEARQLSPHLMTEEERRIYKQTGKAPTTAQIAPENRDKEVPVAVSAGGGVGAVEDSETHKLLREQNDLMKSMLPKQTADALKPGGSKANAEETL